MAATLPTDASEAPNTQQPSVSRIELLALATTTAVCGPHAARAPCRPDTPLGLATAAGAATLPRRSPATTSKPPTRQAGIADIAPAARAGPAPATIRIFPLACAGPTTAIVPTET